MDEFHQQVYVAEIKSQCKFALNAIGGLNFALQQLHPGAKIDHDQRQFSHAEVFRQIHSFLTHTSNISRLFWPPVPKQRDQETDTAYQERIAHLDKVKRAASLCTLYDLDDSNCLRNRSLRDHLEHYDERLDHWRQTSTNHNIASDTIGPRNSIVGLAPTDMMRWFDPSTNIFLFRGEEYNLQQTASEVDRLLPLSVRLEQELWARRSAW